MSNSSKRSPKTPAIGTGDAQDSQRTLAQTIDAEVLFKGARELVLNYNGQSYRLRITAQGKLILTK
jgi:hemin uptake protein HemP